MSEHLAEIAEEHLRAAFDRADAEFPPFAVDSWSDEAVVGQWVVLVDDECRRFQVEMGDQITRGVAISPGTVGRSCGKLVRAVLDELRAYIAPGGLVVSRVLPDPMRDGVYTGYLEFRGIWFRLSVSADTRGPMAVLSALLGRGGEPLVDPVEEVVWL